MLHAFLIAAMRAVGFLLFILLGFNTLVLFDEVRSYEISYFIFFLVTAIFLCQYEGVTN
jgi:hypothetical protein